ncbi:MAG: SDR family NAD(P)-dependent oxidoreductase [Epsilonproteobacteria bacterium]|nr:SDR family NAD(P)-dependent oxidoreductase [Campylobacterota bacterium]
MKKINVENYGPWALITGASSGVGREMAREVASKGIHTILVAREKTSLETVAQEINEKYQVETRVITLDFAQPDAVKTVIDTCDGLEVGLLANCAGYALSGEFTEHSMEEEIALLEVNVKAPMQLALHFSKEMKARKKGGIIFVSSIMALGGAAGWAHYNATKAHNLVLAEGLGEELRAHGVHVIALTPGSIKSGFQSRSRTKSMFGALSPKRVAKCGLWMLGTYKRTHTAGLMNKIIALSTRLTPRWINTKIFSLVVKSLTQKQHT